MIRKPSRHRLEWEVLEGRLCPSVTGAAAYVAPVERLDSYALERYTQALSEVSSGQDGIVFLGDSITDFFANAYGASVWESQIAPLGAADFGVASDTAENLLWRVEHGELAGYPKLAVVNIGTNDLGAGDSVDYAVAAIQAVVEEIQTLSPGTEVLLMGLFPRGATASDPLRLAVQAVDEALAAWAPTVGVGFLDINPELTAADGTISADFLADDVHPDAAGYQVWSYAIEGLLVDTYASELTSWNASNTTAAASTSTTASTTEVSSAGGISGVTADGNVWHYEADDYYGYAAAPWQQLGTLGGAVAVVPSTNLFGQSELFAQMADDSVWVFDYTTGVWSKTGGYLDRGSMVADSDGVVGIAPGGIIFQYAEGLGWAQDGNLGDAASLAISKNLSDQSELFAQMADDSVWVFNFTAGAWTDTGGDFTPGTMIANSNGVSAIAGGTVYHFADGYGWISIPSSQAFVSVTDAANSFGAEDLFARTSDGTVYEFSFLTPNGWTDEYGRLL